LIVLILRRLPFRITLSCSLHTSTSISAQLVAIDTGRNGCFRFTRTQFGREMMSLLGDISDTGDCMTPSHSRLARPKEDGFRWHKRSRKMPRI